MKLTEPYRVEKFSPGRFIFISSKFRKIIQKIGPTVQRKKSKNRFNRFFSGPANWSERLKKAICVETRRKRKRQLREFRVKRGKAWWKRKKNIFLIQMKVLIWLKQNQRLRNFKIIYFPNRALAHIINGEARISSHLLCCYRESNSRQLSCPYFDGP